MVSSFQSSREVTGFGMTDDGDGVGPPEPSGDFRGSKVRGSDDR